MPSKSKAPDALIVSGDARIQKLLSQEGAVVIPAYAFFLDGFVKQYCGHFLTSKVCVNQ